MMRIYSIRERPEYIPAMLESLENHWPACMPWIQKHMEQVRQTDAPLPDAYIAVEKGKVVGGYTLAVKEILWSEDKGLWMPPSMWTLRFGAGISARSCLLMPAGRAAGWDLRGSIWPRSTATTMRSMDFSPLAPTPVPGESPPGCLKILHCHQK